jgi:hypothetical protein
VSDFTLVWKTLTVLGAQPSIILWTNGPPSIDVEEIRKYQDFFYVGHGVVLAIL